MDVSWELLDAGLKILFSRYNVEIRNVSQSHRLEYTDMEYILYHLFKIIDSKSCRKSLHSIYPARNQDDKAKFINNMVILINRQLPQTRISAPRLIMCGGQPFRNLIGSLVRKAAEVDMICRMKRCNLAQPSDIDPDLSEERLKKEMEILDTTLAETEDTKTRLEDLKKSKQQIRYSKQIIWDELQSSVNKPDRKYDNLKKIQRALMVVLGKTTESCVASMDKIAAIQLSEPRAEPKRLSYYVRVLQAHVNSSDPPQSTIDDYDEAMENLISKLNEKQQLCDERLLQNPEFSERYNRLTKLIPLIKVKPIRIKLPLK